MTRDLIQRALRLVLPLLVCAPSAWANPAINVQTFRPSPFGDDLMTVMSSDAGAHLAWSASLLTNFGKNPLFFVDTSDNEQGEDRVVSDQVTMDLSGSLALFDRLALGLTLPLFVVNRGDEAGFVGADPVSGASLGDLRLTPKVAIWRTGGAGEGLGLAMALELGLPTGDRDAFVSDGFTAMPEVVLDGRFGPARVALNLGYRLRSTEQLPMAGEVGNELTFGFGAEVDLIKDTVSVIGELYGASSDFGGSGVSHVEGVAGGRVRLGSLVITAGGGAGFLSGFGNTDYRAFIGIGFVHDALAATALPSPGTPVVEIVEAGPAEPGPAEPEPQVANTSAEAARPATADAGLTPGRRGRREAADAARESATSAGAPAVDATSAAEKAPTPPTQAAREVDAAAEATRRPQAVARVRSPAVVEPAGRRADAGGEPEPSAPEGGRVLAVKGPVSAAPTEDHVAAGPVGLKALAAEKDRAERAASRARDAWLRGLRAEKQRKAAALAEAQRRAELEAKKAAEAKELAQKKAERAFNEALEQARKAEEARARAEALLADAQAIEKTIGTAESAQAAAADTSVAESGAPPGGVAVAPAQVPLTTPSEASRREPPPASTSQPAPAARREPPPAPTPQPGSAARPAPPKAGRREPPPASTREPPKAGRREPPVARPEAPPAAKRKAAPARKLLMTLSGNSFRNGSSALTERGKRALNRLALTLKRRPELTIEIGGHTDSKGTRAANKWLSQGRANEVLRLLINRGIERTRMKAVGYGASQPLRPNDTMANRAKNRRVEIIALE